MSPAEENGQALAGEASFFSGAFFASAAAAGLGGPHQVWSTTAPGSRTRLYGVAACGRFHTRTVFLSAFGLPANPGWHGPAERHVVEAWVRRLKRPMIVAFTWNVRFDQPWLRDQLASLGLDLETHITHVLPLGPSFESVRAGYSATRRRQARRAHERVTLRRAVEPADVARFHELQHRAAAQRGAYRPSVPLATLMKLATDPAVRVLLAERDGELAAGGVFVRDNCVVMYWQGAVDRRFAEVFAGTAVIDAAIRWACEVGAHIFSFGASGDVATLEAYKATFGARPAQAWSFRWTNPFWAAVARWRGRSEGILA